MAKRRRMNKSYSKKVFRKTSGLRDRRNIPRRMMRTGTRL